MSIADNIVRARERVASAAHRAGRNPDEITLMAVSKTFPQEAVREAYEAGLRIFGENRVRELAGKIDALRELSKAEWHLIGHLQSNKAGKAAELFDAIDSVDSLRLAEKLNSAARQLGKSVPILVEVNIGCEEAKSGVLAGSPDFEAILLSAPQLDHLQVRGLMTIPPFADDPQQARPYFQKLRELRDMTAARHLPRVSMDVLSMGMSHDFEVAIQEGSTCVRVGTAIFGERATA